MKTKNEQPNPIPENEPAPAPLSAGICQNSSVVFPGCNTPGRLQSKVKKPPLDKTEAADFVQRFF